MTKYTEGFQHIGQVIDATKKFRPPSRVERRLIESATDIAMLDADEISFLHTLFCQTMLPYRRHPERTWEHRNGNAILSVEAGWAYHPEKDSYVPFPLPYGPKARLVQIHLDSEAVRTRSPEIPVDDSMTAFASHILGWDPNGRELRTLKNQLGHCQERANLFSYNLYLAPLIRMQTNSWPILAGTA